MEKEKDGGGPSLLRRAFGLSFFNFAAVAACVGAAVYWLLGAGVFVESLQGDLQMFLQIVPNFIGAMLMASFIPSLLPRAFMERLIGEDSGLKGMLIGTAVGAATPGGPMTSFPLVLVLRSTGAGRAPLISYLTAWSTMGIHRILVWEIQLLGLEFALVRVLSSAPLGIVAGLLSRLLPPPPIDAEDETARPVKP